MISLPDYVSGSSDEDEAHTFEPSKSKRKRGSGLIYNFQESFQSKAEADSYLKRQDTWITQVLHTTQEGTKISYYCNKVPARACPARIYLLYHHDSEKVE